MVRRFAGPALLAASLAAGCAAPTDPVSPKRGDRDTRARAVLDAWEPPAELLGSDGLGHHGWTADDVDDFTVRWGIEVDFPTLWISDNRNEGPSVRVHTLRAPDVGQTVQDDVRRAAASERPLHDLVEAQTTWVHRDVRLDGLAADVHVGAPVELETRNALFRALKGLHGSTNPLGGPAPGPLDEEALLEACGAWPDEAQVPLARLVLAVGNAASWKRSALQAVDTDALARVREQLPVEDYGAGSAVFLSPRGGTVLSDIAAATEGLDPSAFHAAALELAAAIDDVQVALAEVQPFRGGDVVLQTTHGSVILSSADLDHTWNDPRAALLVDLGGNDTYGPGAAAATDAWAGAAVLVDVRGNDTYGPAAPDLQDASTRTSEAFAAAQGFSQGSAFAAVAILSDGAGDDTYTATVHSQGSALFGVGVLDDRQGDDDYRMAAHGQGTADFGLAILRDASGDDQYRGYTQVQGVGRPGGHGLLADLDGSDLYVAYVQAQEPWLPEAHSAPNYFSLPSSWAYGIDGVPHYMSIAQGVGWGYRHEWLEPLTGRRAVWAGGFGALVDLGDGSDQHFADCMSMGQGFVYGMGMLYDDGGDDEYATFWWGPGASAHMGVGLFWDHDGDDQVYTTRASAGFGYDLGVGWWIDEGGNDTYGGQVHYGRAYLNAFTYFLNIGGDDVYNDGDVRGSPYFGVVRQGDGGLTSVNLLGVFMDLGGGNDTYNTDVEGPGNDAAWYHEPLSTNTNPDRHKGVGLDR